MLQFLQGQRALDDVAVNGLGSDIAVTEISQKYERIQALQDELNKQIVRLRCLKEEFIDICKQLLTKIQEWANVKSSIKIDLAVFILALASPVASFFTLGLGYALLITGSTVGSVKMLKDACSISNLNGKLDTTLIPQLHVKLGQCIEGRYVLESKMALFAQCVDDFADFCREQTSDMLVVRHRGTQVSRQQVLIDINKFMLGFSEEVLEWKGNEAEATACDVEAEITDLSEEELLMLMKRRATLFLKVT